MKKSGLVLILLAACSCNKQLHFEKDYYEKVTKIKFPPDYKIIATADNGEYLTITILDLKKTDCKNFIVENKFQEVNEKNIPHLMGLLFLETSYQNLPKMKSCYVRQLGKVEGKVGWTYIINPETSRLYCEIDYPDDGGN